MGLFLFLVILLAAAWGLAMEINAPQPPRLPPAVQHAAPKPAGTAEAAPVPVATAPDEDIPVPGDQPAKANETQPGASE